MRKTILTFAANFSVLFSLVFFLLPLNFFSPMAFAHGEDAPGPHGGFIQMPGSFHTELVITTSTQFEVYLLDIGFQKPTTERSSVQSHFLDAAGTNYPATCKAQKDRFICQIEKPIKKPNKITSQQKSMSHQNQSPQLPDLKNQSSGKIVVLAQRDQSKTAKAIYSLPLKHPAAPSSQHHQH